MVIIVGEYLGQSLGLMSEKRAKPAMDVTCAEDWPPGGMRELDQALRCPICYEFFDNPTIAPDCSHICTRCVCVLWS